MDFLPLDHNEMTQIFDINDIKYKCPKCSNIQKIKFEKHLEIECEKCKHRENWTFWIRKEILKNE